MRIVSGGAGIDYETALRTIGQRLEKEQAGSFAVEIEGEKIFVFGEADFSQPKSLQRGDKSDFDRKISQESAKTDGSKPQGHRLHFGPRKFRGCYSREDIYRLNKEGKAKRKDPDRIPNSQSISQVLRAMGAYVSRREAKLYSVTMRDGSIEIAYETDAGKQFKEIFRWPT